MERYVRACSLVLILLLAACRKEEDQDRPRVRILQPAATITLNVPDTLLVRVEVQDERIVERVTIALTDANGVPVAPPVQASVNEPSAVVVRELPVANEFLATGSYTLTVTASDGTNEGRDFRSVDLQAAPLRLRALYVTPPVGHTPPVTIWRVDSTGALAEYRSLSEFGGAAIDARRLFLCGTVLQPTAGLAQASGVADITIPNNGPVGGTIPFFQGPTVDPSDGRFYLASEDGFIRGYGSGGPQTFTAISPPNVRSRLTAVAGDRLVSLARHQVLDEWRMVVHAIPAGNVLGQFAMDMEPVDLHYWQGDQVLVFGQRNGVGVIQVRNVQQGGGSDLITFNDGPLMDVARISPGTYFVALPDRIVRYSTLSNTVTLVAQGLQAQALAFEAASGTLYAGVDGQLVAIDPTTGARTVLHTFPHPVGQVLPLLNR